MYYKVMKHGRVIDVLDQLIYLKYQPKHDIMVLCEESEAQAFLSSDKTTYWHENSMCQARPDIETVELAAIDRYEYSQLKILNGKTPKDIIDEYTFALIDGGILT